MSGKWKEVIKLSFKGERFRDHALDLLALSELSQFQKMVAETAKTLWKTANPDRKNLPSHFEDNVRLCLRRIEDGSAVAPLEVYIEDQNQDSLWEKEAPREVSEAVKLVYEVFESLDKDAPLPERLPRSLLPEYAKWGQTLMENEEIELSPANKKPVRLTVVNRQRLEKQIETSHQNLVDISGEVFEADVKQGRFQILMENGTKVAVVFNPDQEERVTTALKEHKTVKMLVKGMGEYTPQGKLTRVSKVDELKLSSSEKYYDRSAKPIEDLLRELAADVPQEEWDKLPNDLNDNLDHYLYGTSKR